MTARSEGTVVREPGRDREAPLRSRFLSGARLLLLSAVLLAGVGACGRLIGWVALTTTVGPTAYLLLDHPDTVGRRLRAAVLGHASAVGIGLALLAAFGLWHHPSIVARRGDTTAQIAAQALAVGLTLFLLHVLDAPHPPAAATALLITSGISRPGPPLYGMLTGLALVLAIAPLLTVAASGRARSRAGDG
ncbi:HPP family protein [Streptomyces sp. F63]|uniref:HPP family protein n=1 Tax=Streptomyces sp. F63 TaxID=2824887 RepID=UPI0027DAB709|nr:HPP family protein [Streptomyces sp. F63]